MLHKSFWGRLRNPLWLKMVPRALSKPLGHHFDDLWMMLGAFRFHFTSNNHETSTTIKGPAASAYECVAPWESAIEQRAIHKRCTNNDTTTIEYVLCSPCRV